MINWLTEVFSNPAVLSAIRVTFIMAFASTLISAVIGIAAGLWLQNHNFPGKRVVIRINRTLMGTPPVVCGLLFYLLFSGVGPFRHLKLLFTVKIMILAQVALITPIVVGNMETYTASVAPGVMETAKGMGFPRWKTFLLLGNECVYPIFSAYLLAFSRAIAEVGAVSMVGGAIAWKTNVMTTAIMQYTNQGNFSLGIALGLILMTASLIVNTVLTLLQKRLSQ